MAPPRLAKEARRGRERAVEGARTRTRGDGGVRERRAARRRTSSHCRALQSTLRVFPVPVGLSKIPMPPRSRTSYRPRMRSSWMAYGSCGKAGKARADGSGVGAGSTCAGADAPTPPGDPDDDIAVIPPGGASTTGIPSARCVARHLTTRPAAPRVLIIEQLEHELRRSPRFGSGPARVSGRRGNTPGKSRGGIGGASGALPRARARRNDAVVPVRRRQETAFSAGTILERAQTSNAPGSSSRRPRPSRRDRRRACRHPARYLAAPRPRGLTRGRQRERDRGRAAVRKSRDPRRARRGRESPHQRAKSPFPRHQAGEVSCATDPN